MLRIAICDDEKHILDELARQIEEAFTKLAFPTQLHKFDRYDALWREFEAEPFDVLFLDIDTPDTDGVAFGLFLRTQNLKPCIIYVSNRSERVFETFAVEPLRFIRKSHFYEEIDDAIRAIIQWQEGLDHKKLVLNAQGSILSLSINDIAYVECFAKLQNIITLSGTHEVRLTLRELENKLKPFGFIRPHKGYLVNYRYIDSIEQSELLLRGGWRIPISKHRVKDTKDQYLRLMTQALGRTARPT